MAATPLFLQGQRATVKPTPATQQIVHQGTSRPETAGRVATHTAPVLAPGLPIGSVAGCRLLEEVAAGGHAVVYRAQHERLGRLVALKALRSDAMAEPGLITRFRREARMLGRFAHPNLPQVYDLVEEGGALFLLLEWCPGIDLQDALARVPLLPWPAVVAIAVQAARALSHVHCRGVIHGDVKPGNLILTRRGLLKLIDFGVASLPSEDRGETLPRLGTPGYLSPSERGDAGDWPDARNDQYALGVVLHQLLFGRKPGEPASSSAVAQSPVPPTLQSVLARCLEAQPSRRYSELSELVDTGLSLLRSQGLGDEYEQVRSLVALLEQPAA